jgi:hypothetical protein
MMDDRWDTHRPAPPERLAQRHGLYLSRPCTLPSARMPGGWRRRRGSSSARLARKISCPSSSATRRGVPLPAGWLDPSQTPGLRASRSSSRTSRPTRPTSFGPAGRAATRWSTRKTSGRLPWTRVKSGPAGSTSWRRTRRSQASCATSTSLTPPASRARTSTGPPARGRLPLRPILGALAAGAYPGAVSPELKTPASGHAGPGRYHGAHGRRAPVCAARAGGTAAETS